MTQNEKVLVAIINNLLDLNAAKDDHCEQHQSARRDRHWGLIPRRVDLSPAGFKQLILPFDEC